MYLLLMAEKIIVEMWMCCKKCQRYEKKTGNDRELKSYLFHCLFLEYPTFNLLVDKCQLFCLPRIVILKEILGN